NAGAAVDALNRVDEELVYRGRLHPMHPGTGRAGRAATQAPWDLQAAALLKISRMRLVTICASSGCSIHTAISKESFEPGTISMDGSPPRSWATTCATVSFILLSSQLMWV